MATYEVKSIPELFKLISKHSRDRERRIKQAKNRALRKAAAKVRARVPVATSELRDGIQVVDGQLISDGPHSEAVEKGARAHWMPLEPLIRWVKLRGAQGLLTAKQIERLPGTTTADHAHSIAEQLAAHRRGGAVGAETNYSSLNAPVAIAKEIQLAIALKGTKPHWFMRDTIPDVLTFLNEEIAAAIPNR